MKRKRKVGRSRRHDRPHLREEKRRKKSKRKNDTTATDRGATVDLGRDRDHHAQGRDETVRRIPDTAQGEFYHTPVQHKGRHLGLY